VTRVVRLALLQKVLTNPNPHGFVVVKALAHAFDALISERKLFQSLQNAKVAEIGFPAERNRTENNKGGEYDAGGRKSKKKNNKKKKK